MGQTITVEVRRFDDFCVFSTDRSITGQDGAAFTSAAAADAAADFPGMLAARLFAADDAINHVYVASNDVIVRRTGSWDEAAVASAATTIEELFRFYPESLSSGGGV